MIVEFGILEIGEMGSGGPSGLLEIEIMRNCPYW